MHTTIEIHDAVADALHALYCGSPFRLDVCKGHTEPLRRKYHEEANSLIALLAFDGYLVVERTDE